MRVDRAVTRSSGCALEDDQAAVVALAGPRAEVNDPVGVSHDRLVVLDDDDRFAGINEPVRPAEQLLDVGEVEAGGRLVEDVLTPPFSPMRVASLTRCRSPPGQSRRAAGRGSGSRARRRRAGGR